MAAPQLMSYNEWMTKTNRKAWHGQSLKDRSGALQAVDGIVQAYDANPKPADLELLKNLLDAWIAGKLKGGQLDTIRDHKGAVTDLKHRCDAAVQLAQPLPWTEQYPGIFIANDLYRGNAWVPDDFAGTVQESLTKIGSKPIGKKLLKDLSDRCAADGTKKVVIEYSGAGSSAAPLDVITNDSRKQVQKTSPFDAALDPQTLLANPNLIATPHGVMADGKRKNFIGGAGTSAVVTWNHKDKGLDGRPAFVALAHELVHAYHYVLGMCYRAATGFVTDGQDNGIMEEEMRTVGVLKYKDEVPSENAIRNEHGLNRRAEYAPGISFANVKATAFI